MNHKCALVGIRTLCPRGGMADTMDSKPIAARRVSSTLTVGTEEMTQDKRVRQVMRARARQVSPFVRVQITGLRFTFHFLSRRALLRMRVLPNRAGNCLRNSALCGFESHLPHRDLSIERSINDNEQQCLSVGIIWQYWHLWLTDRYFAGIQVGRYGWSLLGARQSLMVLGFCTPRLRNSSKPVLHWPAHLAGVSRFSLIAIVRPAC